MARFHRPVVAEKNRALSASLQVTDTVPTADVPELAGVQAAPGVKALSSSCPVTPEVAAEQAAAEAEQNCW